MTLTAEPRWLQLSTSIEDALGPDDALQSSRYRPPMPSRQPVHTVYIPADQFDSATVPRWRDAALASVQRDGPIPGFAEVAELVDAKLAREPIEDLRIDFEDGYGVHADADEDAAVVAAVAHLQRCENRPPFCGIRIKSLESVSRARSIRTLGLFLQHLDGQLPDGFRVTLPKVTSVAQISAMVTLCEGFEELFGFSAGALRFEIQVETPQAILGANGTALIAPMLHAAHGRCAGLHYGTYDYSASVGVAAEFQSMEHPAADYAKAVMQVAAAGTGVPVSDGSTNVLPVGDRAAVHSAWALHARLVRRSLERGFYQGWDLHPAQLPTRYAATYSFYADGLPAAIGRLQSYLGKAASGVLDEPATARALSGFILRALDAGVVTEAGLAAGVNRDRLNQLLLLGV